MAAILIVDDEPITLELLAISSRNSGYGVFTAENGEAALKIFRKEHIDLIITDIFMPEKEGIELIAEIKAKQPDMKIIAISGGGAIRSTEYLNLAARIGATRTFTKPIDFAALQQAVKELLA